MPKDHESTTSQIRLAKPADADKLARMSRRLIEAGLPWWCWTPKRMAKSIRSRDTVALVATVDRATAGFALMYFGDEHAHLNLLAVEPRYRRYGIGSQLLQWLEDSCSTAGIVRIALEVRASNRGAIQFYQRLGYECGDRIPRYYCGQESALRMSRSLVREYSDDC